MRLAAASRPAALALAPRAVAGVAESWGYRYCCRWRRRMVQPKAPQTTPSWNRPQLRLPIGRTLAGSRTARVLGAAVDVNDNRDHVCTSRTARLSGRPAESV